MPHRPMFPYSPTVEGRSWRGFSTLYTIDEAMVEFLAAPSARHGLTNAELLESVVGASVGKPAQDVVDVATYDGVSGRRGTPCKTFGEAFRACCVPYDGYGHRDWRDFDVETLRGCHEDFASFRLPEWVEEMIADKALKEHYQQHEPGSEPADLDGDAVPF